MALGDAAPAIAERLHACPHPLRIIGHYDCDGLAAAGVMCRALHRAGLRFHHTAVPGLTAEVIARLNRESPRLAVFVDLGSGHMELLARLKCNAVVIDHHRPQDPVSDHVLEINAHRCGVDGTTEACAASVAFAVAVALDADNRDLAPIALAGILGDRQHIGGLRGYNRVLVEQAVEDEYINEEQGLALWGADLATSLAESLSPYLMGIGGRPEAAREALTALGLDPQAAPGKLEGDERAHLASWLIMRLLAQGAADEAVETLFATRYELPQWGLTARALARLLDGAGRRGAPELALSLLFGDAGARELAERLAAEHRQAILRGLHAIEAGIEQGAGIQHFHHDDRTTKGAIAGIAMSHFLDQSRTTVGLAPVGDSIIASARGTHALLARSLDLAAAMCIAAAECNGQGGGHPIAAGATIPAEREADFLARLDVLVVAQLADAATDASPGTTTDATMDTAPTD